MTSMAIPALPAFSAYGIELEYAIVSRNGLEVRPLARELLAALAGCETTEVTRGELGWSNELAQHQIELKNRAPSPALEVLLPAFQAELKAIDERLAGFGARLLPGGVHPWMDPQREARVWDGPQAALYRAYQALFNCRSHGWGNLQSMHVNLPFGSVQEFTRLHAAVRLALPILPALAASSPYVEGRWSGWCDFRLAAYRSHQARLPASMGALIPPPCDSPRAYRTQVLEPMYRELDARVGDAAQRRLLRHEWLNARAAIARFTRSAIEIRALDAQECPLADLAIAAAVSALVRRFYDAGAQWLATEGNCDTLALMRILERCARLGELAMIDDRHYLALFGHSAPCAARELWAGLLETLRADGLLKERWLAPLQCMVEQGPLARRLLAALGLAPTASALHRGYRELCQCLLDGRMFEPPRLPRAPTAGEKAGAPGPGVATAIAFLVTCEHGGNYVPQCYRPLFCGYEALLASHRGYDPGALTLARELARALEAPLITARTSRLVVDLNRSRGHPRLHAEPIRCAPARLRHEIIARYYLRYRIRAEAAVTAGLAHGTRLLHLSSHSFTPVLDHHLRTADIGLLYDPTRSDERSLCERWRVALRRHAPALVVRRNYPYSGKSDGLCKHLRHRFPAGRYLGIELEINQKHVFRGGRHWQQVRRAIVSALLEAIGEWHPPSPPLLTPGRGGDADSFHLFTEHEMNPEQSKPAGTPVKRPSKAPATPRPRQPHIEELIDESIAESFPASDPPAVSPEPNRPAAPMDKRQTGPSDD